MIIRSQDKLTLINLDNTDSVYYSYLGYGENRVMASNENTKCSIGKYSSKEKVIKVLDMICEWYQYLQECKLGGMGVNKVEFVFQMPQDSEV